MSCITRLAIQLAANKRSQQQADFAVGVCVCLRFLLRRVECSGEKAFVSSLGYISAQSDMDTTVLSQGSYWD